MYTVLTKAVTSLRPGLHRRVGLCRSIAWSTGSPTASPVASPPAVEAMGGGDGDPGAQLKRIGLSYDSYNHLSQVLKSAQKDEVEKAGSFSIFQNQKGSLSKFFKPKTFLLNCAPDSQDQQECSNGNVALPHHRWVLSLDWLKSQRTVAYLCVPSIVDRFTPWFHTNTKQKESMNGACTPAIWVQSFMVFVSHNKST